MSDKIKEGDTVFHKPSGETWVVHRVGDNWIEPCGWPPTRADIKDCEVIDDQ